MSVSSVTSSASSFDATQAYENTQRLSQSNMMDSASADEINTADSVNSFSQVMSNAVHGAINTGKVAETQTAMALSGKGNMSDVVTSIENAKLTLQTATALRDRFVNAYQDVMRMSI